MIRTTTSDSGLQVVTSRCGDVQSVRSVSGLVPARVTRLITSRHVAFPGASFVQGKPDAATRLK